MEPKVSWMGENGVTIKIGEHGVPWIGKHGVPWMGGHGVPRIGEHGVPRRIGEH